MANKRGRPSKQQQQQPTGQRSILSFFQRTPPKKPQQPSSPISVKSDTNETEVSGVVSCKRKLMQLDDDDDDRPEVLHVNSPVKAKKKTHQSTLDGCFKPKKKDGPLIISLLDDSPERPSKASSSTSTTTANSSIAIAKSSGIRTEKTNGTSSVPLSSLSSTTSQQQRTTTSSSSSSTRTLLKEPAAKPTATKVASSMAALQDIKSMKESAAKPRQVIEIRDDTAALSKSRTTTTKEAPRNEYSSKVATKMTPSSASALEEIKTLRRLMTPKEKKKIDDKPDDSRRYTFAHYLEQEQLQREESRRFASFGDPPRQQQQQAASLPIAIEQWLQHQQQRLEPSAGVSMPQRGQGVAASVPQQDAASMDEELLVKQAIAASLQWQEQSQEGICYSVKEFNEMWQRFENNINVTTQEIEKGALVRGANTKLRADDSDSQKTAQYGRLLPAGVEKLFSPSFLDLQRDDVLVDIGHGIGSVLLQAAFTIGCQCRGIEIVSDRDLIAKETLRDLDAQRKVHFERDDRRMRRGFVVFRRGGLEAPDHQKFLTVGNFFEKEDETPKSGRIKMFCNNFNAVFADRAKVRGTYNLDQHTAGLFALLPPGSILVTLYPLPMYCAEPLSKAKDTRRRMKLPTNDNASFYEYEELSLGEARLVVSWSEGGSCRHDIKIHKYTRVQQETPQAVFLCNNRDCRRSGEALPAAEILEDEKVVIRAGCDSCNHSCKPTRLRRTVDASSL